MLTVRHRVETTVATQQVGNAQMRLVCRRTCFVAEWTRSHRGAGTAPSPRGDARSQPAIVPGTTREEPMALTLASIRPGFVAEIDGIDLTQPVDASTMAALWEVSDAHAVLVFRGQTLSDAQ